MILNPADYLSAKTIEGKILGITIAPNSSGFDEWGFRNRLVPTTTDIVAIRDSHTFGNTATMNDSWLSVGASMPIGGYIFRVPSDPLDADIA